MQRTEGLSKDLRKRIFKIFPKKKVTGRGRSVKEIDRIFPFQVWMIDRYSRIVRYRTVVVIDMDRLADLIRQGKEVPRKNKIQQPWLAVHIQLNIQDSRLIKSMYVRSWDRQPSKKSSVQRFLKRNGTHDSRYSTVSPGIYELVRAALKKKKNGSRCP